MEEKYVSSEKMSFILRIVIFGMTILIIFTSILNNLFANLFFITILRQNAIEMIEKTVEEINCSIILCYIIAYK